MVAWATVTSSFDRRLASGVAVAALVLLVAGLVALVSASPPPAVRTAAPATSTTTEAHGQHLAGAGTMAAAQHAVQSAYCPAPGTEIAGGEPDAFLDLAITDDAYGDGPVEIPAGALVRVRVDNRSADAHEVGVYHESRPGCPLVLATVGPGTVAAVDLRLAAGTYVLGDRDHDGEAVQVTVQSPGASRS